MYIVIHFGGTGQKGLEKGDKGDIEEFFKVSIERFFENKNINFINVSGCQDEQVCNDTVFPNLQEYARKFCNVFFEKNNDGLYCSARTAEDLNILNLGIRVDEIEYKDKTIAKSIIHNLDDSIEGIILTGHSRGAVTAFEVARKLKELAPSTDVYCVADQPVPGNYYVGPGTNAYRNIDLRDLDNIKEMSLIYGVYNKGDLYHSLFHRQIVPKLNSDTKRNITAIPRADHWGKTPRFSCYLHYFQKLANILLSLKLIDNDIQDSINSSIDEYYKRNDHFYPYPYAYASKDNKLEEIGNDRLLGGLYAYMDQSNPKKVMEGFEYDSEEHGSLGEWFREKVEATSNFKTTETENIRLEVNRCNFHNVDNLTDLYSKVEWWLIKKDGGYSSRYEAMRSFRIHVYNRIIDLSELPAADTKSKLQHIADKIRREENWLANMWFRESKNLSSFKTQFTKDLDDDFEEYSSGKIDDNVLLVSLNTWLNNKNKSNSKRYDLVYEIREKIKNNIVGVKHNASSAESGMDQIKKIDVKHNIEDGLISKESEVSRITNEVNSNPNLDKTNNIIQSYIRKYVIGNDKLQLNFADEATAIFGADDDSTAKFDMRCKEVGSLLDENGLINQQLNQLCHDFNLDSQQMVKVLHGIFYEVWIYVANDEGVIHPYLLEHLDPSLYGEPGSSEYNKTLAQLFQGVNQLVLAELFQANGDEQLTIEQTIFTAGLTQITDNQIAAILANNQEFDHFKHFATSPQPDNFVAQQQQEPQDQLNKNDNGEEQQNFLHTAIAFTIEHRHIVEPVAIGVMIGLGLALLAVTTMGVGLIPGIGLITAIGVKIGLSTAATAAIGVASAGCAGGAIGLSFAEAKQWFNSASSFFDSRQKSTTNDDYHYKGTATYQHHPQETSSINF